MQNNSIRNNLTKEDIISDIHLTLGADVNRNHVVVIVEGNDDLKFFKHEFKNENTYLYESYDGKNGVRHLASNKFASDERVIGIRDRDYSNLMMGVNSLFFYDNCCMEMMFIENKDAFSKICCEFYNGTMEENELKLHILLSLLFLSSIRKASEENNWELALKDIPINNMMDINTNSICKETLLKELRKRNRDKIDEDKMNKVEAICNSYNDYKKLLLITQGHDFAKLFAAICNKIKPIGAIKHDKVEIGLRCGFTHEAFKRTKLYAALNKYQNQIEIEFLN